MYLVLLETSGNQNFIFSTNKLRENLGASELIYRTGTKWLLEAVADSRGQTLWNQNTAQLRQNLLQQSSIFEQASALKIEVILATSGKALLLTGDEATAKDIICRTTLKTLKHAPGVDLCGVYEKIPTEQNKLKPFIASQIGSRIYEHLSAVRAQRPGPQSRFQRLPVVDECATSGLPARYPKSNVPEPGNTPGSKRQSAVSRAKEDFRLKAADRINQLIRDRNWEFATNADQLQRANPNVSDSDQEWVAIVHADGNGLGQIFLKFDEFIDQDASLGDYFQALRAFSIALDQCTERAFKTALEQTFQHWEQSTIPLVPLILGGDDLTVMCAGRYALPFTQAFLAAFEAETHQDEIIKPIAQQALGCDRLSACAGVAIVKPHFPFSIAYELAEELITSAKAVKKTVIKKQVVNADKPSQADSSHQPYPCSAIDFHILYDSSNVDLSAIRDRLRIGSDGQDQLYNKPYVITPLADLEGKIHPESEAWVKKHRWEQLQERVQILEREKDGRRVLPNSQAHLLRQSLFMGQPAADAQLNLMWPRYRAKDKQLSCLVYPAEEPQRLDNAATAIKDSLFTAYLAGPQKPSDDASKPPPERLTGFLDAIESVGFIPSDNTRAPASALASSDPVQTPSAS